MKVLSTLEYSTCLTTGDQVLVTVFTPTSCFTSPKNRSMVFPANASVTVCQLSQPEAGRPFLKVPVRSEGCRVYTYTYSIDIYILYICVCICILLGLSQLPFTNMTKQQNLTCIQPGAPCRNCSFSSMGDKQVGLSSGSQVVSGGSDIGRLFLIRLSQ